MSALKISGDEAEREHVIAIFANPFGERSTITIETCDPVQRAKTLGQPWRQSPNAQRRDRAPPDQPTRPACRFWQNAVVIAHQGIGTLRRKHEPKHPWHHKPRTDRQDANGDHHDNGHDWFAGLTAQRRSQGNQEEPAQRRGEIRSEPISVASWHRVSAGVKRQPAAQASGTLTRTAPDLTLTLKVCKGFSPLQGRCCSDD